MLRVTVELFPGGRENGRSVLATADITRIKSGVLADYEVLLRDRIVGETDLATLREYPRYAASVWDLVARGIAAALAEGKEQLPTRPVRLEIPIHKSTDGTPYVRMREIPEPTRTLFAHNLTGSTMTLIEGEPDPRDCAYAWDWEAFLHGGQ